MKILQVSRVEDGDTPLVLHPEVTVIRVVDEGDRGWLTDVLGRLDSIDGRVTGEIEAHGIRFPLDLPSLALLGVTDTVDAIVRADDLPGFDPAVTETAVAVIAAEVRRDDLAADIGRHRQALGAAVVDRDAAAADLEELRRGEGAALELLERAEAERSQAMADHQAAAEARSQSERDHAEAGSARELVDKASRAANQQLDAARIAHREAMSAASRAAAAIEELGSIDVDASPGRLAAAEERLSRAEAAAAGDTGSEGDGLRRATAALEGRRAEVRRLQETLGEGDVEPLAGALDRLLSASDEAQSVVAAVALADTWRDLHQQIRALDAGVSPAEQAAEQRVATARHNVTDAESDFNQPVLTPEQIARVEGAHAAVLEAQDRSEARFGGGRARKRLDDARSEERRVLERLGFSTYADYMMSSSSSSVGPANRAVLDIARQALAHSIGELESLPGAAERTRRRAGLLARRDAVGPEVAALIGHEPTGPEAEAELRDLRETATPDESAIVDLAERLDEVGVVVGPAPHDRDDLILLARSYLAEHRTTEQRRVEVAQAIDALDEAIAAHQAAAARGATEPPDVALPPLAQPVPPSDELGDDDREVILREARWAEVEASRQAVSDAKAAATHQQEAAGRREAAEDELFAATAAEGEAAAAVEAAKAALTAGRSKEQAAAMALARAEEASQAARAREAAAAARLHEGGGDRSALDALVAQAEDRLASAEAAVASAAAAEQASAEAFAKAQAVHGNAHDDHAAAVATVQGVDRGELVDDVVWAVLARLASLRSVGVAGSVPLVLADPFSALEDDEVAVVLDKVGGLAGAVQVVVISDRPAVVAWASGLGPARAAVVAA
ncbi:MAG: hypothetical protein ACR2MB_01780 [Acidimicrobiales bacterium]